MRRTALLAAALFSGFGCVAPTWYNTGIFADLWDGRVVVVTNLSSLLGEYDRRFAVYVSEGRDLSRWTQAGHYAGHVSAATVRGGMLWAFFEGGLYRAYPLAEVAERGEGGVETASRREERAPEGPRGEISRVPFLAADSRSAWRLPFEWVPRYACTDDAEGLWVVGVHEGRIVGARLARDGLAPGGWNCSFPAGPRIAGPVERAAEAAPPNARGYPRADAGDMLIVRAHAGRDLFVYWSAPTESGHRTNVVHAAKLTSSRHDPMLPGAWWTDLPRFELELDDCWITDFCVAPETGRGLGLVARCRKPGFGGWMRRRIYHARLETEADEWQDARGIPGTGEAFRFGHIAGMAWVKRENVGLLLSSNTQRVRIIEHSDGDWRELRPASWLRLYVPEIQVMILLASALFLVIAGATAFLVRFARVRRGESALGARLEGTGPATAPVVARLLAGLLDVLLMFGLIVALPGMHAMPSSPVLPGMTPLVRHFVLLGLLVVYGTAMEATLGATVGKLALGLRVVTSGGLPAGFRSILARNLLRIVDTSAIGLAFVAVTVRRQRLGDLAADTIVVSHASQSARKKGEQA